MKKLCILLAMLIAASSNVMAQSTGYEKAIEFGGMFEVRDDILPLKSVSAMSLTFINGYKTNDYFFVGAGVGVDYSTYETLGYSSVNGDYSVSLPIFARAKVNFTNTKISPFASFDLGYNLMIGSADDYVFGGISNEMAYKRSGVFLSPTIGADFKVDYKNVVYLGLSYMLNSFGENNNSYSHSYNSIGFRLGWKF